MPDELTQLVHDLRSPLMVVEAFATSLARSDAELAPDQRADHARRIAEAAVEMRERLDQAASRAPK